MRLTAILSAVPLALCLAACGDDDRRVGGNWYVRSVPAGAAAAQHVNARVDLIRETDDVRIVADTAIGSNVRFYPPSCVAYEAAASESYVAIRFACGNREPVQVAVLSTRGVVMDTAGIHPAPGVVMRADASVDSLPADTVPRALITVNDMRAAAERQPVSRRDITPEITRANRMMAWGGFLFIMFVALVIGTYRKRVM